MAPLPRLVKLCAPYLAPGGLMVAFLGNRFEDILAECKPLLKEKGLFVHDSKPYILKGKELKRNLLVLKKRK
jgi:16S rRNA G527 N7-methylase RsmG